MKSIISFGDIPVGEFYPLLKRAGEIKEKIKGGKRLNLLDGKIVGLLFEKPSTRTRVSFESASILMGGNPIYMARSELQLSRGEPVKDTARILGSYLDILVVRAFENDTIVELSEYSGLPVINALSDLEHPTQLVSDMLTIGEVKKRIKGIKIAYIGDGNNVANSLILAAATGGANVTIACPEGYEPDSGVLAKALKVAKKTGSDVEVTHDVAKASKDADVFYTDVWVSMGQEKEAEKRAKAFRGYQINSKVVAMGKKDAVVMHCLPAHRGQEITDEVIEGRRSVVWQQGENKLYGAGEVLEIAMGRENG